MSHYAGKVDPMLNETVENKSTGWSNRKRIYQLGKLRERKSRAKWKRGALVDRRHRNKPRGKLPPPPSNWWHYSHRVLDLLLRDRRHWYAIEVAQALDITEHRADRALRQLWGADLVVGYQWRAKRVNGKRVNYWRPNTYIISKAVKTVTL